MASEIRSEEPTIYLSRPADRQGDLIIEQALAILRERHARGEALTTPNRTAAWLNLELSSEKDEVFACLFLDNRHRVIRFERLFRGTIDGASVYPRVIVRRALELNAAAVILCHNHPSGEPEPSVADEKITRRLKEALALVDVRVLDHFVVAGGRHVSFAERGLM